MVAVAIMMVAGLGIAFTASENQDTSEAVIGIDDVIILILISTFIMGMVGGYMLNDIFSDHGSGSDPTARAGEANLVASSILQGVAYNNNSIKQLSQIWGLTYEHFIRYAELAASFQWSPDASYNAEDILVGSTAYQNAAVAIANSAVETSQLFHNINERLGIWNNTTQTNAYKNTMTVSWLYGTNTFGSKTAFDGYLTSTTTASSGADKVYISDVESLWVFGGPATIKSSDGTKVTLKQGENDLTSGFVPGVYTLQDGLTYAGPMVHVIDSAAASVTSGIVMKAGDQTKLAVCDPNGGVNIDGGHYTGLSIRVQPDDGSPQDANITGILTDLRSMMSSVNKTLAASNAAASAVWDIYDILGTASSYLTTLMVPDNYDNIDINSAQKELMTLVAMSQLEQLYSSGKAKIDATDFQLSSDSMTLFCRGDIRDKNGDLLYQNVIFTPLFYNKNTLLTTGNNTTDQPAIIAIWGNGQNLSGWNFTSNTKTAGTPPLEAGSTLNIYEMKLGGQFVTSASLEVRQISYIKASDWDQRIVIPIPPPPPPKTNWPPIIMIVVGIILIIIGMVVPPLRPVIYLGIILVAGGMIWLAIDYFLSHVSFWKMFGLSIGGMHELT